MKKCCFVCAICDALLAIGALNWGLVGFGGLLESNFNVVNLLLGGFPLLENIVYILVGIAGIKLLLKLVLGKDCPCRGACKDGACCGRCGKEKCMCGSQDKEEEEGQEEKES